jgi:hypothetical protein
MHYGVQPPIYYLQGAMDYIYTAQVRLPKRVRTEQGTASCVYEWRPALFKQRPTHYRLTALSFLHAGHTRVERVSFSAGGCRNQLRGSGDAHLSEGPSMPYDNAAANTPVNTKPVHA